jgi:hypothetical protein
VAGQTVPNVVTVKVSPTGEIKIYNEAGATHVILDVAGWYTTGSSGYLFRAVTSARALDTRIGTGGFMGKMGPGELHLRVSTVGGLPPNGVAAVVLNATATEPTHTSFLTLFNADSPRPDASNLNFTPNQTVPNAAVVKVAGNGRIKVYNSTGNTHVVVDVAGWFGP